MSSVYYYVFRLNPCMFLHSFRTRLLLQAYLYQINRRHIVPIEINDVLLLMYLLMLMFQKTVRNYRQEVTKISWHLTLRRKAVVYVKCCYHDIQK